MKKAIRRACSIIVTSSIIFSTTVFADDLHNEEYNDEQFGEYISELADIEFQCRLLENYSQDKNNEAFLSLQYRKEEVSHLIEKCDYDSIYDDAMTDVIINADYSHSSVARNLSMSELTNVIETLKSEYTAVGRKSSYNDGSKTYSVYQIYTYFKKGSSLSKDKLERNDTKVFYGNISANSSTAQNFVDEVISIYVSKGVSTLLELIPGVKYLPYELAFSNKPSPTEIYSSGNALTCNLVTSNVLVFTYVLDETTNSWVYCASGNSVTSVFSEDLLLHMAPGNPDIVHNLFS